MGGCSLGGALSVVSFVKNAAIVVHAAEGCLHQTFSILHAVINELDEMIMPEIFVSGLTDKEVIFGGEDRLYETITKAAENDPDLIIVLTSCVPETIGDDAKSVCLKHPFAEKILFIQTSGFLGGTSKDGENLALISLGELAPEAAPVKGSVALIGEKNLESEADENYSEVVRLLDRLGLTVTVRLSRNASLDEIKKLGTAECFILRDERSFAAAKHLAEKFSRPLIKEFPRGLLGAEIFLQDVGLAAKISEEKISAAVLSEKNYQSEMLKKFSELSGKKIFLGAEPFEGTHDVAREVVQKLSMIESLDGTVIRLPFYLPVGTSGVEKMLYVWRRSLKNA